MDGQKDDILSILAIEKGSKSYILSAGEKITKYRMSKSFNSLEQTMVFSLDGALCTQLGVWNGKLVCAAVDGAIQVFHFDSGEVSPLTIDSTYLLISHIY